MFYFNVADDIIEYVSCDTEINEDAEEILKQYVSDYTDEAVEQFLNSNGFASK